MRALDVARHLWRETVHRRDADAELDAEVAAWVQLRAGELERAGESPGAASRMALLELGGADQVKEAVRDTRRTALIESIGRDVRYAFRTLVRTPVFAVAAVLTLALGLGGAIAIFSLVDTILVRPVPGVRDPATLVSLDKLERGSMAGGFSWPDYADYRAAVPSLTLAASVGVPLGTAAGSREPELLRGALVSDNYFKVLGVRPAAGRLLSPDDDASRAPVAVISQAFWQRAYGGAAAAVGSTIQLDGHPFTVVGVAGPGFGGTIVGAGIDAWAPLSLQPVLLSRMSAGIMESRSAGWLELAGRLAPGATIARAQREARLVAARLGAAYPVTNGSRSVRLRAGIGLDEDDRQDLQRLFGLMSAAAILLLLMACANVAGLLVVRAQARERELAIRLAVGARRRRVAGQLLVEGALLAGAAAVAAVVLARGLARAATTAQPALSLMRRVDVSLDTRSVGVAVVAAAVVAVLVALAPALRLSHLDPMHVLRDGRAGAGASQVRLRRLLVGGQVAVSLALLSASVVVGLADRDLLARRPGFDRASLALVNVDLTAQGYDADRGLHLYRRLLDRLATVPSVAAFSFAKTVPPRDWSDGIIVFREGAEPPLPEIWANRTLGHKVYGDHIAPDFFHTLGIPLLAGREFTLRDDLTAPSVAVVNESFARMLWPGESPIGKHVEWPPGESEHRPSRVLEVVGVVADHQYTSLTVTPSPVLFYPVMQEYDGRATIVARTSGDPRQALTAVRRAVHDVDPALPVTGEQTMTQRMAASLWPQRLLTAWLGVIGALALGLSFVGLYGVVAQIIGQRARELSVRLALGASPARVTGAIVREGAAIMLVGLAAGAPLAYVAVLRVRAQLGGMHVVPVAAALASAGVIGLAMLLATLLPARRVTHLSPIDALRAD